MFLKKPKEALQSILRTTAEEDTAQSLPTDLSIIREPNTSRLLVEPAEVIAQVHKLESRALAPDPTLPPRGTIPVVTMRYPKPETHHPDDCGMHHTGHHARGPPAHA